MGVDFYYPCTGVIVRERILTQKKASGTKEFLLCDLEFEDEHGHAFRTCTNVPVVFYDNKAEMVQYPENVFADDDPQEIVDKWWPKIEIVAKNSPKWYVENDEVFSGMVRREFSKFLAS